MIDPVRVTEGVLVFDAVIEPVLVLVGETLPVLVFEFVLEGV